MRIVPLFLFLISASILSSADLQAQTADILIKNGKILDGTGNSWFIADIALQNGKIVSIGNLNKWQAPKIIYATGLMVALECYFIQS